MVKNRSRGKNVCKECVITVDGEADVLSRLSIGRVGDYEYGRVRALPTNE
jgi:hypothetical protein